MKANALPIVATLVATMLAGCAKEAGNEDRDDALDGFEDLKATPDTGIIRGIVVDQAIVPIPGVTISIRDVGTNTTTTENGAFGFEGLEPGSYILTAAKPGFQETQVATTVEAGLDRPPIVQILLEPDPAAIPTLDLHQFNGFLACSFALVLVLFAACGVEPVASTLNNDFIAQIAYDRAPDWVQSEMVWQSSQALGDSMQVSWTDPCHGAQRRINASAGPSPQIITFDRQVFEEMELEGCDLWLRVFSSAREGTDLVQEETWNGPWRSTVYPAWNSTAPDAVQDAVDTATTQCIPGVGCMLNPVGEDCVRWVVLFDACLGVGGIGATLEQDFEIFTASFFNFLPEPGWTFGEDGNHPIPGS